MLLDFGFGVWGLGAQGKGLRIWGFSEFGV